MPLLVARSTTLGAWLVPFKDVPLAILPRSPADVARSWGRGILGKPVMTVNAAGSLLAACPIPPVHVPIQAVNPPTTQPVRCLLADESSCALSGLRIAVVHFDGVRTEVSARVFACRSYSPVVYRPASVKSSSLRIAVIARIVWKVAAGGPGSLDLVKIGGLGQSALDLQLVIWVYQVGFRAFGLDAACPRGDRVAFEFSARACPWSIAYCL